MQLLVILALLLYGGKTNARELIEEVKPLVETIGGDDIKSALKSAEEIAGIISAVSAFAPAATPASAPAAQPGVETAVTVTDSGFPLAPINNIADDNISYALKQYFQIN